MELCSKHILAALTCCSFALNAQAGWTDVYSNDFNHGLTSEISTPLPQLFPPGYPIPPEGQSIQSVSGLSGVGNPGNQFSGTYLVNMTGGDHGGPGPYGTPGSPTTITLSNLPDHTSIRLSFLFAAINTWDGNDGDFFNVAANGMTIFSETFSHRSILGLQSCAYPGCIQTYAPPANGLLTATGQNSRNYLTVPGWGPSVVAAYDMGLDPRFQLIPHTGSTLTLQFWADGPGWQGGFDEYWAIDNLKVSVFSAPSVPEPETYAMLLAGLGVLGAVAGRRKLPQ